MGGGFSVLEAGHSAGSISEAYLFLNRSLWAMRWIMERMPWFCARDWSTSFWSAGRSAKWISDPVA